MEKKLLMIVNPRAGRSRSHGPLFDAAAILSEGGYAITIHRTTAQGDARETVTRMGKDYDVVVAVGGDGTLNEVIAGLRKLEDPPILGYLPHGSTNDFASGLAIPANPAQAAQKLLNGRERLLDTGLFNDRPFAYVGSFGAFSHTSYAAPQNIKNALGHFAYILAGVKDLDTLRPYRVKLTADGENLDGDYLFGAIFNSTSIGGVMKIDPQQVVLDDGKFELLLIPTPKTPLELQHLVQFLGNQQLDQDGVVFRHVSRLHLETEEDLPWTLDGEYAPSVPAADVEIARRSIRILL